MAVITIFRDQDRLLPVCDHLYASALGLPAESAETRALSAACRVALILQRLLEAGQ
jgi:hypothetical protein